MKFSSGFNGFNHPFGGAGFRNHPQYGDSIDSISGYIWMNDLTVNAVRFVTEFDGMMGRNLEWTPNGCMV